MSQLSKEQQQQYHAHMQKLLALYKEFDEAIALLRELGRDFTPGSDGRFLNQVTLCQRLRSQLVDAENFIPATFDGL